MNNNEIKKALYKQNPEANLTQIREGKAYYSTFIDNGEREQRILFEVPVDDMGDASFFKGMPAKLLIRWIMSSF